MPYKGKQQIQLKRSCGIRSNVDIRDVSDGVLERCTRVASMGSSVYFGQVTGSSEGGLRRDCGVRGKLAGGYWHGTDDLLIIGVGRSRCVVVGDRRRMTMSWMVER